MSSEEINTRIKILEATAKLLVENKGKGVRMSDIAKYVGISRQAVYLHFSTRTELLVATTQHIDQTLKIDERLAPSRQANSGIERLDRYIEAWGAYIPEIYGVAKALLNAKDTDDAAGEAWRDRMEAMRDGCRACIEDLARDGDLNPIYAPKEAIDLLWALLSVRTWENLVLDCHWDNQQYIEHVKQLAKRGFTKRPH